MRKSTEDLLEELQNENCKIDEYLKGNGESFVYDKIKDFWETAIEKSGYSKSNIINKSDFSYCYFYDVINGRKIPGRDKIIRLILTMHLAWTNARKRFAFRADRHCIPELSAMQLFFLPFQTDIPYISLRNYFKTRARSHLNERRKKRTQGIHRSFDR